MWLHSILTLCPDIYNIDEYEYFVLVRCFLKCIASVNLWRHILWSVDEKVIGTGCNLIAKGLLTFCKLTFFFSFSQKIYKNICSLDRLFIIINYCDFSFLF